MHIATLAPAFSLPPYCDWAKLGDIDQLPGSWQHCRVVKLGDSYMVTLIIERGTGQKGMSDRRPESCYRS